MHSDPGNGPGPSGAAGARPLSGVPGAAVDASPAGREQAIREALAANPQALAALDRLVANLAGDGLGDARWLQALEDFMAAPNAATAAYIEGRIAQERGTDPARTRALLAPEAGTLTIDGQVHAIDRGVLLDADGRRVGRITNDGLVRLHGQAPARSVYADLAARVLLRERVDGRLATLLDLHPAGRLHLLDEPGVHPDLAQRVRRTLVRTREEGMSMQVNQVYRPVAGQDRLYAQGRTAPGEIVTRARGGHSWHNYGLAADVVFSTPEGEPDWPDAANWTRYGQIAADHGLTWGGTWSTPDRPHVEYHPGLGAGDAGGLIDTYRRGGLEAVWERMGIGRRP